MTRPTLPSIGDPGSVWPTTYNNAIGTISDRLDAFLSNPSPPPAMPAAAPSGWTRSIGVSFDGAALPIGSFLVTKGGASDGLLTSTCAAYSRFGSLIKLYPDGQVDTYGSTYAYPSKVLSTVLVSGVGVLDIWHHTETVSGTPTAMGNWMRLLWPDGSVTKTYGRATICYRSDPIPGFGLDQLIIADGSTNGEMDWPEGDTAGILTGFFHPADGSTQQQVPSLQHSHNLWKVATIEWSSGLVRYLLNGAVVYGRNTAVPSTAQKFVTLQTGGSTGTTPNAFVSGHTQVAWATLDTWNG